MSAPTAQSRAKVTVAATAFVVAPPNAFFASATSKHAVLASRRPYRHCSSRKRGAVVLSARMVADDTTTTTTTTHHTEQSSLLPSSGGNGRPPNPDEEHDETEDQRIVTVIAAATTITVGLAAALATGVLSGDALVSLAAWFEARGPNAVFLYGLFYFALELVAVPAIPLTLGSGYLFGVAEGTAVVSVASTLAAAGAFLISRYGLREYIERRAQRYPRFRAMDRAIGREGFKFVFLLRLSPLLPFSISNYLYGLTSVPFPEFVLGSWLGMLPGSIAYVSAGAALNALTDITEGKPPVSKWLILLGVGATITVLSLLGRLAAKVVEEESSRDMDGETGGV